MGREKQIMENINMNQHRNMRQQDTLRQPSCGHSALALLNRGLVLASEGRLHDAVRHYDQSLQTWDQVALEGNEDCTVDAAYTMVCKADVLMQVGRIHDARNLSEEALALLRLVTARTTVLPVAKEMAKASLVHRTILTTLAEDTTECVTTASLCAA